MKGIQKLRMPVSNKSMPPHKLSQKVKNAGILNRYPRVLNITLETKRKPTQNWHDFNKHEFDGELSNTN